MKTYAILGLLACASFSQAQSPQERIERLNSQTLQLLTQRLDAHQAVINRMAAERATRPSYDPFGTTPPAPAPAPTYTPPTTDRYSFPAPAMVPTGRTRMTIDGVEVKSREEALVLIAAASLEYLYDQRRGVTPRLPDVVVTDPPAGFRSDHPNIRVAYTAPAPSYDKYATPSYAAPRYATGDGLRMSIGSAATTTPSTPAVTNDGLTRTLGSQGTAPPPPTVVDDDGLSKR